ncbi:unnamed protein product [Rhizophagus irregularis]|nr:unnamed protein product [Rhizophagus irregularis]
MMILFGNHISFSFSDKSTTESQYVVLKQLKNSKNINGADFILQLDSYYTVMSSEKSPKLYRILKPTITFWLCNMQAKEICDNIFKIILLKLIGIRKFPYY